MLELKNTGVVRRDDGDVWNRVEVAAGVDFDRIAQLLVSDPVDVPLAKHNHLYDPSDPHSRKTLQYKYANVVLVQHGSQVVMLLPYAWPTLLTSNTLNHWCFVNKAMKE